MRYMLDTNIVSYYLRRRNTELEERINAELKKSSLSISSITRAELRFGQMGMQHDDRRRSLIDGFLQRLPSIEFSADAADRYGQLKQSLKTQGKPIGDMDTLIASHAMTEKLILVTHNTRHFENIPALKIEDWMAP
jgi:tRNA(fMet)-specific endonuclease VapC